MHLLPSNRADCALVFALLALGSSAADESNLLRRRLQDSSASTGDGGIFGGALDLASHLRAKHQSAWDNLMSPRQSNTDTTTTTPTPVDTANNSDEVTTGDAATGDIIQGKIANGTAVPEEGQEVIVVMAADANTTANNSSIANAIIGAEDDEDEMAYLDAFADPDLDMMSMDYTSDAPTPAVDINENEGDGGVVTAEPTPSPINATSVPTQIPSGTNAPATDAPVVTVNATLSPTDVPPSGPTLSSAPFTVPPGATPVPTVAPTPAPTPAPTSSPTNGPVAAGQTTPGPIEGGDGGLGTNEGEEDAITRAPTDAPITAEPTTASPATASPATSGPTIAPTDAPTVAPTGAPTDAPTNAPTDAPTDAPTNAPTDAPTNAPTNVPTDEPTPLPTPAPADATIVEPNDLPCDLSPQDRRISILSVLSNVTDPVLLLTPSDPRNVAAEWLIGEDALTLCPFDPKIVQRWALALVYFSTGGDDWFKCSASTVTGDEEDDGCGIEFPFDDGEDRFLAPVNECSWASIECNDQLCVTEVEFGE